MCNVKESGKPMSKLEVLGYIFVFGSMSLSMGLYKLEIRKSPIDKKHYGSIWLFFFFFTMLTGFCQKRNSVYFKRSFIAIFSMLFGMLVFAYAFRPILF